MEQCTHDMPVQFCGTVTFYTQKKKKKKKTIQEMHNAAFMSYRTDYIFDTYVTQLANTKNT